MTPPAAPTPAARPPAAVSLASLGRAVRRYSLAFTLFVLVAAGAAGGVYFFLPLPSMTGVVTYRVYAKQNGILGVPSAIAQDFNLYKQQQVALLKTKSLLTRALADPQVAGLPMLAPSQMGDPVAWLSNSLRVDFPQGPEFMRIGLEGNDEAQLLAVLKAVSEEYGRESRAQERKFQAATLSQYQQAKDGREVALRKNRAALRKLQDDLQIPDALTVSVMVANLEREIGERSSAISGMVTSRYMKEFEKVAVEARASGKTAALSDKDLDDAVKNNPAYQDLVKQALALEDQIKLSRRGYKEGVPESESTASLRANLAKVDAELKALPATLKPKLVAFYQEQSDLSWRQRLDILKSEIATLTRQEEALQTLLAKSMQRRREVTQGQLDLVDRVRELDRDQAVVDQLTAQIEALRPQDFASDRVELWEPPAVHPGTEGKRRTKYTAMAGFGVLLAGLAVVQGLEYRNRRVLTPDELATGLGLPVLGTVPFIPRTGSDSAQAEWTHHLTEAVNTTRTVLLSPHRLALGAAPVRSVLITSATSGEGKTSLATHLAVSLAGAGRRVLLIDADMRRPAVHTVFGIPPGPGLAEYLVGAKPSDVLIQPCRVDGLDVMTAGKWAAAAAAALATERWHALVRESAGRYDFVLVDSPPILPVADALSIARTVDGVVVAVMRDHSRYLAVQAAVHRLTMIGARTLGVVLSGTRAGRDYSYDKYYYRATADADAAVPADAAN